MSRLQSCVATDWEILLRPRVGEGRNTMVRRGWCANPVSDSVHDRFGSFPEDRGGERKLSHGSIVLDTFVHVKLSDPRCSVHAFVWHLETAPVELTDYVHA